MITNETVSKKPLIVLISAIIVIGGLWLVWATERGRVVNDSVGEGAGNAQQQLLTTPLPVSSGSLTAKQMKSLLQLPSPH